MKSTQSRLEKIARNINAMDLHFEYINQTSKFRFWNDLRTRLFDIIKNLSEDDVKKLIPLCKANKARYFGLI